MKSNFATAQEKTTALFVTIHILFTQVNVAFAKERGI